MSFNGIDNSSDVPEGQQHRYHGGILEAQTLQKMISAATFLMGNYLVVATSSHGDTDTSINVSGRSFSRNSSYRY